MNIDTNAAMSVAAPGACGSPAARLASLFWLGVLLAHMVGSALWWWFQPGGFPAWHARFWVNGVVPLLVLAWSLASLEALHRHRGARLVRLLPAWPGLWIGLACGGRLVFPITLGVSWLIPLAFGLAGWGSLRVFPSRAAGAGRRTGHVTLGLFLILGLFCVWSRQPPAPTAVPWGGALEPEGDEAAPVPAPDRQSASALVNGGDATLTVPIRPLTFFVSPLLRFQSRAPDGCWTVFVPSRLREEVEPRLVSQTGVPPIGRWSYRVPGLGEGWISVLHPTGSRTTSIETRTRLDGPVHAHLASFCDLEVRGHRRLAMTFSACPDVTIEVRRFDYPFGRPARFAYVDAARVFRVVGASSGEKGPFRTLAQGRLETAEPLTITFLDEDRPVARVTLRDWSAQAGTELSPTAGWGVPVNAIEFSLNDEAPSSPASIFITLAATSVGRGWDCVTHPAGTYRNRITIEPVTPVQGVREPGTAPELR